MRVNPRTDRGLAGGISFIKLMRSAVAVIHLICAIVLLLQKKFLPIIFRRSR